MKNLLLMILLVSGLAAATVKTEDGMKELTLLSNGDRVGVMLDYRRALRVNKAMQNNMYYGYRDVTYTPYIQVINRTSRDFKRMKSNRGGYNGSNSSVTVRTRGSIIHRVYYEPQIRFMMSKNFKVSSFQYRGKTVYLLED